MRAVVFMAIALFVTQAANADEDIDADIMRIMTQFGLRGEWSPDCYRAIKPDNPRLSVSFSNLGLREISMRLSEVGPPAELMSIKSAAAVPPDMLELQLDSLTTDPTVSYRRTDTYQKIGDRVRLFRSELTSSSPQAQAMGHKPRVIVEQALMPISGSSGDVVVPSPVLEQCRN